MEKEEEEEKDDDNDDDEETKDLYASTRVDPRRCLSFSPGWARERLTDPPV